MSRVHFKKIAETTCEVLAQGFYETDTGKIVDISRDLQNAKARTITYSNIDCCAARALSFEPDATLQTRIWIAEETTLTGAKRLHDMMNMQGEAGQVCVLSFASARHPGGGFLSGAKAQEESIARVSGLYACIKDSPMYSENEKDPNRLLYQDMAIYTPNCPVFRTDDQDATFLESPYCISVMTVAAPNAECLERGVQLAELEQTFDSRVDLILAMAASHGHRNIVLGAFGCGVFGNDLKYCALSFRKALYGKYRNVFGRVLFSVTADKCETFRFHFGKKYTDDVDIEDQT